MVESLDSIAKEPAQTNFKEILNLVKQSGQTIFECLVRPDWERKIWKVNLNWKGDSIPALGAVNYMVRMFDQTASGPEVAYIPMLCLYHLSTCYAIYQGIEKLF